MRAPPAIFLNDGAEPARRRTGGNPIYKRTKKALSV
jgi:hypothetical protein